MPNYSTAEEPVVGDFLLLFQLLQVINAGLFMKLSIHSNFKGTVRHTCRLKINNTSLLSVRLYLSLAQVEVHPLVGHRQSVQLKVAHAVDLELEG